MYWAKNKKATFFSFNLYTLQTPNTNDKMTWYPNAVVSFKPCVGWFTNYVKDLNSVKSEKTRGIFDFLKKFNPAPTLEEAAD